MPEQNLNITFGQGLDLKTDPWQVVPGKFLRLVNSIFSKGGQLLKRNGYALLSQIPGVSTYLTTLNGNLTTISTTINAYIEGSKSWVTKGTIMPMEVSTLPLLRNNNNQTQADAAIAPNGFICTVYTETDGTNTYYKYVVADSTTGQNIIAPTPIPAPAGAITGAPRVFLLNNYFIILCTNTYTSGGVHHLQYVAISVGNPNVVVTNVDIDPNYAPATTVGFDAVVAEGPTGNTLFIAWNTTNGGQAIKMVTLTANLILSAPTTFSGIATMMSVCVDDVHPAAPIIYVSYYDSAGSTGYVFGVDQNLIQLVATTQIITTGSYLNIASAAQNGVCTVFLETAGHVIQGVTVLYAGTIGTALYNVIRGLGLASKAFIVDGVLYFLSIQSSTYQPTYFLINGSTSVEASPVVVSKLAYENGGAYYTTGLPNVLVTANVAQVTYLYKDLIEALATLNNTTQTTAGGIYSQTGINLGTFNIGSMNIDTTEIAQTLNMSGGFLWMYDGYLPVEQNFFLWPEGLTATASASSGSMTPQPYYYQAVYSWCDNQGLVHRSAPSIPVTVTLTDKDSVSVVVPTLRQTYKTANPVKIEIYRWSAGNQVYYQTTSILAPLYNDTTADSVTFLDTNADSSIIGNNIIYTTGGVVEDVNAPATNLLTLFDTRLWMVDAEDQNLLWFSKQVIEGTPVEMSDLFTMYIPPTTAAQGSTGPITAIAPLDDKLIIFKNNAMYYINGTGPDNTGANNQYSQPIFITATVGCANQQSIVFMPSGLMFQSDKGIWLLGRDLSTNYIGSPVEGLTQYDTATGTQPTVQSAVNVPQTNQVRFTLNTGITLMYDYFFQQWGTFGNVPAVSSCIFQGLHTYLDAFGDVFQETPGLYLDEDAPVLMSFTTSWINVASLQGFERFRNFYFLGQYYSPHLLNVNLAYDYNASSAHNTLIRPTNFSSSVPSSFGEQPAPFGSPTSLEQWKVHAKQQKCQSFQISVDEVFDPSYGVPAGAGFTFSGINMALLVKKGSRPIRAINTAG